MRDFKENTDDVGDLAAIEGELAVLTEFHHHITNAGVIALTHRSRFLPSENSG